MLPAATSGSLVASAPDIRFAGVQLGAVATGMVAEKDRLTFSVAQPMHIESGTVQMAMPVGRTADGTVVQRKMEAGLAPSGRELDLGLSYAVTLPNQAALKLGFEYALDAGHVRGASAFAVAASFGQSF
jgi:subtilase-type serine protease